MPVDGEGQTRAEILSVSGILAWLCSCSSRAKQPEPRLSQKGGSLVSRVTDPLLVSQSTPVLLAVNGGATGSDLLSDSEARNPETLVCQKIGKDGQPCTPQTIRLQLGEIIGKGSFGEIRALVDSTAEARTPQQVIKIFSYDGSARESYTAYQKMKAIDGFEHNTCFIEQTFYKLEAEDTIAIVMPRLTPLTYHLRSSALNDESLENFKQAFSQLFQALFHLHGMDIVHRDIKLDNIGLNIRPGGVYNMQLLDLDDARKVGAEESSEIVVSIFYTSVMLLSRLDPASANTVEISLNEREKHNDLWCLLLASTYANNYISARGAVEGNALQQEGAAPCPSEENSIHVDCIIEQELFEKHKETQEAGSDGSGRDCDERSIDKFVMDIATLHAGSSGIELESSEAAAAGTNIPASLKSLFSSVFEKEKSEVDKSGALRELVLKKERGLLASSADGSKECNIMCSMKFIQEL